MWSWHKVAGTPLNVALSALCAAYPILTLLCTAVLNEMTDKHLAFRWMAGSLPSGCACCNPKQPCTHWDCVTESPELQVGKLQFSSCQKLPSSQSLWWVTKQGGPGVRLPEFLKSCRLVGAIFPSVQEKPFCLSKKDGFKCRERIQWSAFLIRCQWLTAPSLLRHTFGDRE